MIFKTLNGDLTIFNKTLISTRDNLKALQTVNATVYNKNGTFNLQGLLVNSSQSVSTFTKLNNALKTYNGNLLKSTQLQNAYIQAIGKQNTSLGNYLAGLNGAKASIRGYIKSLVAAKAASIGLQIASVALNTAISMGITLAISSLVSAITKWINKEKEAREEAIENAKTAKEEANNLSELLNKYNQLSREVKSNQGVKEDLLNVQSDLLEALGIEVSQIDNLIEKYGDLNTAINQITSDSLRDAQGDLMAAVDAYEKDLINVGKSYANLYSITDRNILNATGDNSVKAFKILEKSGIINSGSYGTGGGALVLTGDDTVEGILENYQKLKDAQEALNKAIDNGEVTMEEMISNPLYQAINARLDQLNEAILNYNTAINDLNKSMAQQQILQSLSEQSSVPETKEEFEAFKQDMIDAAIASTKFKGSQDDVRDSIINALSTMHEFKKYFEELTDVQSSTLNNNPISFDISSYKDAIDDFQAHVKTLGDALSSLQSGEFKDTDFADLAQEFPELADRADNLEEAISGLLRNSLEELLKTLGENVPSGLANSLTELTEIALGVSKPLDNAFSSIQKSYDVLHDFQDVMEAGFDDHVTDDLLSSVASLSGELNTMVAGFYAGAVTADELYNALTQHYEIDLENYGKALVAKNELNEDFYNNIGMTSAEVVEQFSKDYGIDLKNCKSYAEAKIAIEEQTLKTISAAWSSYYDAQSRTFKNLGGGRSELEARAAHGSGDAAEILKQIDVYEVAMDALDDVVYHGLSADFEKISNKIGSQSSSSSSSAKDFEETFDWIETAIDRIERSISNLGLKADSVYDGWSSRNSALQGELSAIGNEIAIQQAGYEKYMREASSVGLSEEWASKVRNGQIDINSITNEDLADRIKEYQSWYEKALDCQDAIAELNETVSELYENSFDNVVAQYDSILSAVENSKNMLDESINQTEERGYIVNAAYYEALMRTEKTNIEQMKKERDALVSALNNAVKSGAIEEGSQAWADMQEQISEVTLSIEEANTAMIQYGNSIRDVQWQLFDLLQDRISLITAESDFLIDLLSNDKLYDERGQLTSEGNSTMGLHGQNYNVYMEQADKYAKEILRINSEIANDPHNQDLIDRRNELLELQQESILAAEDEKQAIVDMVEEGINLELESLKELIDTYNDALDAQKDLYDYQKNIAEQTKEIASLRKQLSAYEGDLSEENRARIQQIKVQLEDAEENLEETQYERYISDQKKLLDELYLEYETVLNQRLDDVDALIADMISEINLNASSISETLSSKAESVGYTLSESMYDIWSNSTGTITNVLEMYGSNLISGIDNIDTSVEDVISGITDTVDSIGTVNTTITGAIDSVTSSLQSILNALSSTNSGISSNVNYSSSVGSYSEVATGNTNTSSVSGSSSAASGFFIYKKNNYPKNRLNINTSIIDRLKYNDFDDSFDARRGYYSKMGLPGTYTGTNTQNAQMINWMKVHGYKNGVYNLRQSEWAWTQENGAEAIIRPSDGAVLTPLVKGDTVLNADTTRNLLDLINSPKDFIKEQMGKMVVPNRTVHDNISNDIQMSITLPNVQNYEQFKYAMQHDPNFEKMVQAMTVGRAAGKGSLRKYSM